jgi:hypothetical protein
MPTSSGNRWTGSPGSSRRPGAHIDSGVPKRKTDPLAQGAWGKGEKTGINSIPGRYLSIIRSVWRAVSLKLREGHRYGPRGPVSVNKVD